MCPCHGGVYYADGERTPGTAAARLVSLYMAQVEDGSFGIQAPHYPTLQDTLTASAKSCKEGLAHV